MGPLAALVQSYERQLGWTMELPHLGVRGCERHHFDIGKLPAPSLSEINTKTKDPHVLCVEVELGDGNLSLVPLISPCAPWRGSEMTRTLVRLGVHPLDIIMATLDLDTIDWDRPRQDVDPRWTFRNSVEWLFWIGRDQLRLEAETEP